MDSRSAKVSMWLSKMFGDQQVPSFEENPWTMDVLCQLMEWNETRDRDVTQLIEDLKQKTEEYKSDADYVQDFIMDSVGLSTSSLSSTGSSCLKTLVDSSLALNLKDTSQTSFVLAINDLTSDRLEAENRRQRDLISELSKKLTEIIMLEKSLQTDLLKADADVIEAKAKAENRKQNMDVFIKKMKEWSQLSQNLENELKKVGFDPSLDHRSLVELSEKLKNVNKEVASLNEKLKSYQDLTPNLYAAKVKIEETKLELIPLESIWTLRHKLSQFQFPFRLCSKKTDFYGNSDSEEELLQRCPEFLIWRCEEPESGLLSLKKFERLLSEKMEGMWSLVPENNLLK